MIDFNCDFSPASETNKSVKLLVSLSLFPETPERWWFEFDIKAVVNFDFKSLSLLCSAGIGDVYLCNNFFLEL